MSGWRAVVCRTGVWRTTLCCLAFCAPLFADEVITLRANGKQQRRIGTIVDVKANELTLEASGRNVRFPLDRVLRYETERLGPHEVAETRFAARDFPAALEAYGDAFRAERRRWVKREILSRVVWCQHNVGRNGEACKMFGRLVADDPETHHLTTIPLQWDLKPCPADVEQIVGKWWSSDRLPTERLLVASWMLTSQRERASGLLRELAKTGSPGIRSLAIIQLLRLEMLTLKQSRIAFWQSHIESMPHSLRAGAWYLLGKSHAKFNQSDQAAIAWLRVPMLFGTDVVLSQRCLNEAAGVLANTHPDEARRLYRQTIQLNPASAAGQLATARLADLGK